MLNVPDNIVIDITSATQATADSLWPIIIFIITIPLSFFIIRKVLQLLPRK